jgi:hypothetical protein
VDSLPQLAPASQAPEGSPAPPAKRGPGRPKGAISKRNRATTKQITALLKLGRTPKEIQDELGISTNTIEATQVAASRARVLELLPIAEKAIKKQLDRGDGTLGIRLVEAAGVLTNEAPRFSFHDDAKLQLIVQNLAPKGMVAVPAEPKPDAIEGEIVNEPGRPPVDSPDSDSGSGPGVVAGSQGDAG